MPDESCSRWPQRASCSNPEVLAAQVEADAQGPEGAGALADNFAGQWLQLRKLNACCAGHGRFPDFNEKLRQSMRTRDGAVLRGDREGGPQRPRLPGRATSPSSTSRSPSTTASRASRATSSGAWRCTGDQRGGILTQASILTVTSNPTRTSPGEAGQVGAGADPRHAAPAAAAGCAELADDKKEPLTGTLRQRMEQHRRTRSAPPATRGWTRSASAWRTSTPSGTGATRTAMRRSMPPAFFRTARSSSGPAQLKQILKGKKGTVRAVSDREDADLCPGARPGDVRQLQRGSHRREHAARTSTDSRRW